MLSNNQPTNNQSINNLTLSTVKYFGKDLVVVKTDQLYKDTVNKLIAVTSTLKAAAAKDITWSSLASEVALLSNYLLESDNVKRYQLEIVKEGLLPYLNKLNSRLHFDKQRFRQISCVISAITNSNSSHPCFTLMSVDEVVIELRNNRSYLWKSELLTILEAAVDKQWHPIISDNRNLLLNIAGKFIAIGLIGVVGWPLAFLYPLYRVALNMSRIASEYEQLHRVTLGSLVEVAKTIAVIFACMQLLTILSIYASLGYFCLLCGAAVLFVSANRQLIKQLVPVLAPHIAQIDLLVSAVDSLDHTKLIAALKTHASALANHAAGESGSDRVATASYVTQQTPFATSARVEEIIEVESSAVVSGVAAASIVLACDEVLERTDASASLGRSDSFLQDVSEYVFADTSSSRGTSPRSYNNEQSDKVSDSSYSDKPETSSLRRRK